MPRQRSLRQQVIGGRSGAKQLAATAWVAGDEAMFAAAWGAGKFQTGSSELDQCKQCVEAASLLRCKSMLMHQQANGGGSLPAYTGVQSDQMTTLFLLTAALAGAFLQRLSTRTSMLLLSLEIPVQVGFTSTVPYEAFESEGHWCKQT